jgi:hypothetical protein
MESIQNFLISQGFTINGSNFVRGNIIIPSDALVGHSIASFQQKAIEHGWIARGTIEEIAKDLAQQWGVELGDAKGDITFIDFDEVHRETIRIGTRQGVVCLSYEDWIIAHRK